MGAQVISQVLVLFLLMALGFLSFKLKITTKEAVPYFSSFGMKVTLPCLIVGSFLRPFSRELLGEAGIALGVAFVVYGFAFLLAWVYPYVLRMKGPERGVHRFALIASNSGLIGFPVVEAVLGSFYIFHVSIFNVPLGLLAFSVGIWLIAKEEGKAPSLSWRFFVNPALVATVVGFALFLFSIPLPDPLEQGIRLLGGVTTPLFMVIIGVSIAQADIKRILGRWKVYVTVFMRLFVVPVLTLLFCYLVGIRGNLLILPVLLTAMPAASTTSVIAGVYNVAVEEASAIVILSTLLSAATIPLTVVLLHYISYVL